jgi:hypothetical protein
VTVLFHALLVCSDDGCEAADVEVIGPLEEIEAMACDCGLGLHLLGWPEQVTEIRAGSGT